MSACAAWAKTVASWEGHRWFALPVRGYLGLVFVYASLHKLVDPAAFALDVATYDILPLGLVNPTAIILPYVELVAGALLVIGWRVRGAALLILGMIAVFTIAVSLALVRGIDTTCGCFASQAIDDDPISVLTLLRDAGWGLLALYVLLFDRRPLGVDGWRLRGASTRSSAHPRCLSALLLASAVLLPSSGWSQAPAACEALEGHRREQARKLLESQRPYDCCHEPIASCLRKKNVCRLAYRLAQNICSRVAGGQRAERIARALAKRAQAIKPSGAKARFELNGYPAVGRPSAPITVVEYACARCPFCGLMTPGLYAAVSKGSLASSVRLVFKPFPLRSHAYAKEANLGLMAAARRGKFWPFMKTLYAHVDAFSPQRQLEWAEKVGIKRELFAKELADPATRAALIASKKEGLRNKVDATPALFINGQRYRGEHDLAEVIDVLEERADRANNLRYR